MSSISTVAIEPSEVCEIMTENEPGWSEAGGK
jgi:hypothetical protein